MHPTRSHSPPCRRCTHTLQTGRPPKSSKKCSSLCLELAVLKPTGLKKKKRACKRLKDTVPRTKMLLTVTFLQQIPSELCSPGSNRASHHPERLVIHQPERMVGNSAYICCSCQSVSLCTDREREQRSLTVDRLIIHLFSPCIMRKRKSHNSRASLRVLQILHDKRQEQERSFCASTL